MSDDISMKLNQGELLRVNPRLAGYWQLLQQLKSQATVSYLARQTIRGLEHKIALIPERAIGKKGGTVASENDGVEISS